MDNETAKAIGGCFGVGIAWIIGTCLTIVFWIAVVSGVIWGLKQFGVIG